MQFQNGAFRQTFEYSGDPNDGHSNKIGLVLAIKKSLYFCKDAPGVGGRAYPSWLVDLTSSLLIIFWVDLDPNV